MAYLWIPTKDNEWAVAPLEREAYALEHGRERPLRRSPQAPEHNGPARLQWAPMGADGAFVLMAPHRQTSVRVNGTPLHAGIRVLRNRDEIRLNGTRMYFSTERLAQVTPFPGADRPTQCPRCKQPINEGQMAVRCPNPRCGVWHHQSEVDELPCWTYTPNCANCGQETELSSGFRWTPEGL